MTALIISLIVLATLILLILCVLVVGLLRSYATVLQRLHELDGGVGATSSAPPFRTADGVLPPAQRSTAGPDADRQQWPRAHDLIGQGLAGEIISVRTVDVPRDTVIAFLSSGCSGCGGFWAELAERNAAGWTGRGRVVVVTKGPEEESIGLLRELAPAGVDLIMSSRAWEDYDVPGSPYVIVVDGASGRVKGEGSGTSLSQVSGLMQRAYADAVPMTAGGAVVKPRADAEREVDVDRALLAAGIGPGHPSLYADIPVQRPADDGRYRLLDMVADDASAPAARSTLSDSHSRPVADHHGAVR